MRWQNKAMSDDKVIQTERSSTPDSQEFLNYMAANWGESSLAASGLSEAAKAASRRRAKVASHFAGKTVVVAAGSMQVRSNDTEYRYRPHAAFTHLTGWGSAAVPDSVLVIKDEVATLFLRATANKSSPEYFSNPMIGEFWVGPRPSLSDIESLLGIKTKNLEELAPELAKYSEEQLVELDKSEELATFLSELRLVKDDFEISQMREAVKATALGFDDILRNLSKAANQSRGERLLEGVFFTNARVNGYDLGYESIVASGPHACILHWTRNDGDVRNGDLILVDAGVELDSGYTADITRTVPVSGTFSPVQRKIYQAVLDAADAAFAIAKPGIKFFELHNAAMAVIADRVHSWGLLAVSVEESLKPEKQFHRRWMVHGTSHHLGLDVHDCAQARRELYKNGILEPGMVFTIEPGLYFHENDLEVPAEFRGIGVRIEDNVLVTKNGVENLSSALPREPEAVEAWLAKLR
jgi:Xaa-Pro aminopeptidase